MQENLRTDTDRRIFIEIYKRIQLKGPKLRKFLNCNKKQNSDTIKMCISSTAEFKIGHESKDQSYNI